MTSRPSPSIRHTSRSLQMYRIVKFVIRHFLNAFKAYHKFPSTIASVAGTKAISGRGVKSARKRPAINRNVDDNVNSRGVSNGWNNSRAIENECRCQGFAPLLSPFASTAISIASRAESLLFANDGSDNALHSLIYVEHSGVRRRIAVVASESGRCRFHSAIVNQFVIESRPDNDEKIVSYVLRKLTSHSHIDNRSPALRGGMGEEKKTTIQSKANNHYELKFSTVKMRSI